MLVVVYLNKLEWQKFDLFQFVTPVFSPVDSALI